MHFQSSDWLNDHGISAIKPRRTKATRENRFRDRIDQTWSKIQLLFFLTIIYSIGVCSIQNDYNASIISQFNALLGGGGVGVNRQRLTYNGRLYKRAYRVSIE